MKEMNYSAGMVSCLFWFVETRKTADLIVKGKSKGEIKEIVLTENIYQVKAENRSNRIFNAIYKRLIVLPKEVIEYIVTSDIATSKLLILISVMKADKLFFEFMYEVFRGKIILGDYIVTDRDINIFFDEKKRQSEIVSKWTEESIAKLKQTYIKILIESGLISVNDGKRTIVTAGLNYKVRPILENNSMLVFLNAITGEA
jgi:hypothetical protein